MLSELNISLTMFSITTYAGKLEPELYFGSDELSKDGIKISRNITARINDEYIITFQNFIKNSFIISLFLGVNILYLSLQRR